MIYIIDYRIYNNSSAINYYLGLQNVINKRYYNTYKKVQKEKKSFLNPIINLYIHIKMNISFINNSFLNIISLIYQQMHFL